MSTKLHSGLRLKDPSVDLFELIPRIARAIRPSFESAAQELVATEMLEQIDNIRPNADFEPTATVLFDVEDKWREHQKRLGARHGLNDPLRFSIVFGRSVSGKTLAYPYYLEPIYGEALDSLELFEDYHYQDQSDRPDDISEEDWEARIRDWDSLLNSEGSFGDLPLWQLGETTTMEPFSAVYLSRSDEEFDLNSFTTPAKRLEVILKSALLNRFSQSNPAGKTLIRAVFASGQVVRNRLNSAEGSSVESPAPLPKGLIFKYQDIERYEVDPELIEALYSELQQEVAR